MTADPPHRSHVAPPRAERSVLLDEPISWRRRGATVPLDEVAPPARTTRSRPGGGGGALSLAERVRIARTAGTPQAVVRVLAYRRGRGAVWRTMTYVTRNAEEQFVVEGDMAMSGQLSLKAVLDDWARDFSTRANGRDVVHLEVSAPPGYDRDRVFAAARAFGIAVFGTNHQYLLAEHRDTPHPHCHLIVKLQGHDGQRLDPRKHMLAQWRASFAAAARDQGLALEASSRAARGVGHKGVSQPIYQLRRRGVVPATDLARQNAAIAAAREEQTADDPFAVRAAARNAAERAAFQAAGDQLARAARMTHDPRERAMLLGMADDLIAYAAALPQPRSEHQELVEQIRRAEVLRARAAREQGSDFER